MSGRLREERKDADVFLSILGRQRVIEEEYDRLEAEIDLRDGERHILLRSLEVGFVFDEETGQLLRAFNWKD